MANLGIKGDIGAEREMSVSRSFSKDVLTTDSRQKSLLPRGVVWKYYLHE